MAVEYILTEVSNTTGYDMCPQSPRKSPSRKLVLAYRWLGLIASDDGTLSRATHRQDVGKRPRICASQFTCRLCRQTEDVTSGGKTAVQGSWRVLIFRRRGRRPTTFRHGNSFWRGLPRQGEETRESPLACLALRFRRWTRPCGGFPRSLSSAKAGERESSLRVRIAVFLHFPLDNFPDL